MNLINFILPSLKANLTHGHISASDLLPTIEKYNGSEGYYCLFDLEPRDSFQGYRGFHSPALGYYVLDFDSSEDMELAKADCLTAIEKLHLEPGTYKAFFSGGKGFHLYIRDEFFTLPPSENTAKHFERIVNQIGKDLNLSTLDDGIYQANRKFRIPNSRHPKTGLYKVELTYDQLKLPIAEIVQLAKAPKALTLSDYKTSATKYAKGSVTPVGSVALSPASFGLDVTESDNPFTKFRDKVCISRMLSSKHKEGRRHEVILTIVADYYHQGRPESETETAIRGFCSLNGIEERFERDYLRAISDIYSGKRSYSYGCYSKLKKEHCSGTCELYKKLKPEMRAEVTDFVPAQPHISGTPEPTMTEGSGNPNFPDQGARGRILSTHANFEALLDFLGITIEYNVIKKDVSIHIPNTTWLIDTEKNNKLTWLTGQANKYGLPSHQVPEYVALTAMNNTVNPVARWIESKPWDGVSRLAQFYGTVVGADDNDPVARGFKETLMRKWLISAVAAAYEPNGVSAHGVLVFSGAQNMGKTHWFKRLVPSHLKLSKDGLMLDPKDKDLVYQAVTNWMVELGEIDATFRKADIAQLKAFITKDTDLIRLPYHREASEFARRTVFFASVNESSYLSDHTGNRRFWTIETVAINANHGLDMQQVWAEVLDLYKKGTSWYLTKEEVERLSSHNEKYEAEDPYESKVACFFSAPVGENDGSEVYTCTEILDVIGYKFPTQRDTRAVSRAVQKLFKAGLKITRSDGILKKGYRLVKINQDEKKEQIC